MTDEPLLTLRQVAAELGLPESTVRYYRDAFLDHIPSVGTGRRRRYPPPAVAVLRSVAEGYAAGRSREAILDFMGGGATVQPARATEPDEKTGRGRRQPAGISNLELLAAIVDGEREQRDALWQMAKEIVRLTDVLEGQEKVLTEIGDHAGVRPALAAAGQPPLALGEGRTSAGGFARPAAATIEPPAAWQAPLPAQAPAPAPSWAKAAPPPTMPPVEAAPAAPAQSAPPARASGPTMTPSEMERLKAELESERQLVERLRESKVKLEHRVSHAEAALDDQRPRKRSSVLGRILGTEDKP